MKLIILCAIALGLSCVVGQEIGFREGFEFSEEEGFHLEQFSNLIDHFDPADERTYKQRFWYDANGFDFENGPIFLYICGEYECGVNEARQFPVEVAKEHNAIFIYLEHRFYGDSHPFSNLATDNLKYLTARHALADIAVFLTHVNDKIVSEHKGEKRKIIVVGGSYPGALSAWFRMKYPHIADASWASSAVINAVENMDLFDWQIYESSNRSSDTCTRAIQGLNLEYDKRIQNKDKKGVKEIKDLFGASAMHDGDFAFYFIDIIVGKIQYGSRTELCTFLESISELSVIDQYRQIATHYNDPVDEKNSYDRNKLKDPTIVVSSSGRAWTYQYCTEFGFFQTPYPDIHTRSDTIQRKYWDDRCIAVFGKDAIAQARETNIHFGALSLRSSNIFFTNGGEDPWRWVGVTASDESMNKISRVLQCENCGHCVELYNETSEDSDELKAVRSEIKEWIDIILYGHLK
ncbi:unnamed protein product [Moneuplotes crassus]|uniref:Uncharacterized protein n=1 Tax=Euplotes crassus TaxID=5936 RepID=A0AAD1UNU8_EUPCR|nr:unnamed protein product [Moneuplotes crassus]